MSEKQVSLAVHLHLFYLDMWPEMRSCLENISEYPYDLYVTMTEDNSALEAEIKAFCPNAKIWKVENRGYDVGAFVYFLNHINLDNYAYVIKLHTKRNLKQKVENIGNGYGCSGSMWREWLLSFVQKDNLKKCISALDKDEKLGACCYYKCIHPIKDFLGTDLETREKYKHYMFGLRSFSFIAGTMFIMRARLLADIQKMGIDSSLFDVPDEKHTMQFAHIIERSLGEVIYFNHGYIKDVFTPFARLRRAFFLSLLYLKRFIFQKKLTKSGYLTIKIFKIPFIRIFTQDNNRVRLYF